MLHQALLQKPAGGALGDAAQHGAELADGQQVGVGFKFAFILESGHGLPPVCGLSMADGTPVPDGSGRPILGPWPPFGLRFPRFFPALLKKHFVRRNGLFSPSSPNILVFRLFFNFPRFSPAAAEESTFALRNRTQNPLLATACGFESHHRHQIRLKHRYVFSPEETSPNNREVSSFFGLLQCRFANEKSRLVCRLSSKNN